MHTTTNKVVVGVAITVIGGFILALLVSECRDYRSIRESVHQWQEERKKESPKP